MTITTRNLHPDTPHTRYCLTAIEQVGSTMLLARKLRPEVAQMGDRLLASARTGNWFTAAKTSQEALELLRNHKLTIIADGLAKCLEVGNERIARPYLAELNAAKAA